MTLVGEIERTELVTQLVAAIGEEPTESLIKCVMPEGRGQVATKDDRRVMSAELRAEIAKQTRVYLMALTACMVTIWATLAAQFFV